MANENNKRFVYRTADKKTTTYLIPIDERQTSKISLKTESIPSEPEPARRVVVIRNAKNQKTNQEPVNLNDFNPEKTSPIMNNGNKSVYFIRRSTTAK